MSFEQALMICEAFTALKLSPVVKNLKLKFGSLLDPIQKQKLEEIVAPSTIELTYDSSNSKCNAYFLE